MEVYDELERALKEIERLNNIINEFDKWLDEESEKTILSTGHLTCLMMCKNKLQELKGSNGAIPPETIGTNGEDGGLFDYGDR